METTKISSKNGVSNQTLDDILFEGKNKDYGAYDLRVSYLKTINKSFYFGTALFVIGLGVPILNAKYADKDKVNGEITLVHIYETPPPPVEAPIEIPPPPPIVAPDVPSTRFLPPQIVANVDPEEETPPTVDQLKDAPASTITNVGNPDDIDIPIDETPKKAEPVEITTIDDNNVFTILEQMAEFPGGNSAMYKFIAKNLHYPVPALRANVSGKVYLSFVIDKNGEIYDAKITKGMGFGCDEEALRVVQSMPKWNPGRQSGRAVKSMFNLPIVFTLE